MPEESEMLKKAERKLHVAQRLLAEGEYEDAVSRAYYAMFHAAKAALSLEQSFPRTHSGVVSDFGSKMVRTGKLPKDLGVSLSEAKSIRELADYALKPGITQEDAKHIVEVAKQFVRQLSKYVTTRIGEKP